jgi:cytochrome P450
MSDNVVVESLETPAGLGVGRPVVRPWAGPKLIQWLFQHPEPVLSILRDFAPILLLKKGKLALVTRYDDVKEVFLADDAFGVPYTEKLNVITGGVPFILGMEDSREYRRSRDAMRSVMRLDPTHKVVATDDIETRLAPATEIASENFVSAAGNRVDMLELSRKVTFDVLLDYFGTPAPRNGDIIVWATRLFESIFHVGKPDPELDREAQAYAEALRAHLQSLTEARRHSGDDCDDVLGRCIKLGLSDREIVGQLAGFIVAGLPQPAMILPKVIEQLLRRPKMLAQAQEAARRGDDATLAKYVFEAMRFDPLAPFLQRITKREHVLAAGTSRAKLIEPGTHVMFFFASAMMDERRVPNPKSFNPERPQENYVLFGYGLHQCFGIHMNKRLLPLMLKPLLKQHGLRRASGPEGHLRKQGVFPDQMVVCFDAGRIWAISRGVRLITCPRNNPPQVDPTTARPNQNPSSG